MLLRNAKWLPTTGISAHVPSPSSSTTTPTWTIGPIGTNADSTPAMSVGKPCSTRRYRYTTKISLARPSPTDRVQQERKERRRRQFPWGDCRMRKYDESMMSIAKEKDMMLTNS